MASKNCMEPWATTTHFYLSDRFLGCSRDDGNMRHLEERLSRMKDQWNPTTSSSKAPAVASAGERELESLQSTIQETRRILEASRKLLEKIAEREHPTQP